MGDVKPSEALFVRTILPYCKTIGPLWMASIAADRAKKRRSGDSRTKSKKYGGRKTKKEHQQQRQQLEEVSLCVTLLRKLYREVRPACLRELMLCWIDAGGGSRGGECVMTRGDARGRMRRVDGGRGADKVWRLDVIVSILFHGMPLSSSDSGLIVHGCHRDLCVRPHHLRFRVASVSVVLAMKVLHQRGYTVTKATTEPTNQTNCVDKDKRLDEYVDLCGPFDIDQLGNLKNERVQCSSYENYKLSSSADDFYILNKEYRLKQHYMKQLSLLSTTEAGEAVLESVPPSAGGVVSRDSIKDIVASRMRNRYRRQTSLSDGSPILAGAMDTNGVSNTTHGNSGGGSHYANDGEEMELIEILQSCRGSDHDSSRYHKVEKTASDGGCHDNTARSAVIFHASGADSGDHHNNSDMDSTATTPCLATKEESYPHSNSDADMATGPSVLDFESGLSSRCQIQYQDSRTGLRDHSETPNMYRYFSDRRRSSESKLSKDDDGGVLEFIDQLYSMRCNYKPGSSLKFTTNIFSPTSDSDDLVKSSEWSEQS